MIFSDNYDKLIEAQKAYNSEVQNSLILSEVDYVTDFFGSTFSEFEGKFKTIYDYLTTINTKTNKVVNYSSYPDNGIKAHTVIRNIVSNTETSKQFLTTPASFSITTVPHLSVTYGLEDSTCSLMLGGRHIVSKSFSTSDSNTKNSSKIAFMMEYDGKQYVVVRELTRSASKTGTCSEINDFVIDPKTKVIVYIRNYSEVVKSDGFVSRIQNAYVSDGSGAVFISKLNGDKPATLAVQGSQIIFDPTKTQINDYNDSFNAKFSYTTDFLGLKAKSKKLGKAVTQTTNSLGFGDMFSSLASKNTI